MLVAAAAHISNLCDYVRVLQQHCSESNCPPLPPPPHLLDAASPTGAPTATGASGGAIGGGGAFAGAGAVGGSGSAPIAAATRTRQLTPAQAAAKAAGIAKSAAKKADEEDARAAAMQHKQANPAKRTDRRRVLPNEAQREKARHWMDAVNWIYNASLDYINITPDFPLNNQADFEFTLRHKFVNKAAVLASEAQWQLDSPISRPKKTKFLSSVPAHVRGAGVRALYKAYSSNLAKQKKAGKAGRVFNFELQFRSKKKARQQS